MFCANFHYILWHLVKIHTVLNSLSFIRQAASSFDSSSSSCNCQGPKATEINRVFIESRNARMKRDATTTYDNLRIHLTYDDSVHNLPSGNQRLLKDRVISKAIEFWERALATRRLSAPIKLARACAGRHVFLTSDDENISSRQYFCVDGCAEKTICGDVVVPETHLQGCRRYDSQSDTYHEERSSSSDDESVWDADFLLYVAASNTSRCGSSVAYATYCQLEVEFDRPIAGFINVCPSAMSTHESDLELAVATIKHEILHALGFSLSLYGLYRDSDGNPLTPRLSPGNLPRIGSDKNFVFSDRVVRNIVRPNWLTIDGPVERSFNMMVTPKVTVEVRRHFNCSTLEGAELEDQGPAGTRLTHWEKRLFENELMTGIYTQNPVVSRISLALMEDTGWYTADYSYARPLEWGSNLGCEFAMKSCFEWITRRKSSNVSTHPYCTDVRSTSVLKTQCSMTRKSMSLCNMHEYAEDIAVPYRYSEENPRLGGIVSLADYCPYLQEFSWNKDGEYVRGSDCTLSSNTPDADSNFAAEYYGADSRCFNLPVPFSMSRCAETFTSNNYGSGCYQFKCTPTEGLVVYVNGMSHRCYKAGQIIDIRTSTKTSYHRGSVTCPPCEEICGRVVENCPPEAEPPLVHANDNVVLADIPCVGSALYPVYITLPTIILLALFWCS